MRCGFVGSGKDAGDVGNARLTDKDGPNRLSGHKLSAGTIFPPPTVTARIFWENFAPQVAESMMISPRPC
jgi:hypothetical protein